MQAALAHDLREYAGKRWPSGNAKFRKGRLADLLGFSERRARSFWEGKAAAPRDHEIEAIKALIGQRETADAADQALAKRIAELEAKVAFLVSALAGDEVAAARAAANAQSRRSSGGSEYLPSRRPHD